MGYKFAVYEYGKLKDIFNTLQEAKDCGEYLCDTLSVHIQLLKDDEEPKEFASTYNWNNFPGYSGMED